MDSILMVDGDTCPLRVLSERARAPVPVPPPA